MRIFLISLTLMLGSAFTQTTTAAQTDRPSTADLPESPWKLGVALGLGIRTNPLALSDDIPVIINLDVGWFGKRWFFDNGDVGFTLTDREHYTVDLVGRLNNDRVFFNKTNARWISIGDNVGEPIFEKVRVPKRKYAVEIGVEILADGNWGYFQATAFHDVSGTHGGYELFADYSYSVRKQRWFYEPSFGVSWKSRELNDYYWGVREDEKNILFDPYRAGAGLNMHARFLTSYQINRHWAFVAVGEYERINTEAANSPIVTEKSVLGIFAGFKYEY